MITILTSPKPFIDVAKNNQINAIKSWKRINADVEIIVYGNAEGTAEICKELQVNHVPDIKCSSSGIPLFNAITDHAEKNAKHDLQVYTNCDILFWKNLSGISDLVNIDNAVLIGFRWDLKQGTVFDIYSSDWVSSLNALYAEGMVDLSLPHAKDYFIFRRGQFASLNDLVIGRGAYDDALLAYCFRNNISVCDCSQVVMAIHQYHDYNHVPKGVAQVMKGPDARFNVKTHRIVDSLRVTDANYKLGDGGLVLNQAGGDKLRNMELRVRYKFAQEWAVYPFRALWHFLVKLGIYNPPVISASELLDAYRKL